MNLTGQGIARCAVTMSREDQEKWDARYAAGAYSERPHPTRLLAEWLPRLRKGLALDVGCGAGRNALYLADHGFEVEAVDISEVGLVRARERAAAAGVSVQWRQADLERAEFPATRYDLIVMIRYINRDLLPRLVKALKPGGCLLTEHHLVSREADVGPKNPAFRLQRGELTALLPDLVQDYAFEGMIEDPDGRRVALAQFVGHRPWKETS